MEFLINYLLWKLKSFAFFFSRSHCAATRVWFSCKCIVANQFERLIRFWDYKYDDGRGSICVPLICVRSQTTDGHARGHRGIISVWGRVEISEKPREWAKIKPEHDLNPSLLKITQIMWGAKPSWLNENSQHFYLAVFAYFYNKETMFKTTNII